MFSYKKPIIFNTPHDLEEVVIYFANDIHVGNILFDNRKWDAFERLLEPRNAFVIFVGDIMENATRNSKSCVYSQTLRPHEQKQWWVNRLRPLKPKIICITDGNHEYNRSAKEVDDFPLYDIALGVGIEDRYRAEAAFVDIGVGRHRAGSDKQWRYVGYVTHQAQNLSNYGLADAIDGIDFCVSGHTHKPRDLPLSKLVYDSKRKSVSEKPVENIVSGSFLSHGDYGMRQGKRPVSKKLYKLVCSGHTKSIESIGFYV